MQIILPWPPAMLNPNSIAHWSKKYRAKQSYKKACWAVAKNFRPQFADGKIKFRLTFVPPMKRNRDEDNLIASMKSGFDGLAQAWGIDDLRFSFASEIVEPKRPGCVILETLTPCPYKQTRKL